MLHLGSLLLLVGSMGFVPVTANNNDAFVIDVFRSGGNGPQTKAIDHYSFTVAKNGNWEFRPPKHEGKAGKLGADELNRWIKEMEDGGLYEVESNPHLGALDEPYMEITVNAKGKKTQVRISLAETLSQVIEKKIVELVRPGK